MFLIKTRVGPSAIHGNGVFACEPVGVGQTIWRFHPGLDLIVSEEVLIGLPDSVQHYLRTYAYRSMDMGGKLILSGDHAKFLNHSDEPNTEELPFISVARRAISVGDEITCNYGKFCVDWTGFENEPDILAAPEQRGETLRGNDSNPHRNLYTRLKVCSNGIGVFAIREIPEGMFLFEGDNAKITRIAMHEIEKIADAELRRMYFDFCPVVAGKFIAPVDFNQLTMSWYMNHSDTPNVRANDDLRFFARRTIEQDEELTADYATFSEHAAGFIKQWRSLGGGR
jgi:SET domain-containing protein